MPVILLSARAGEEARVEGLEAGADDYLVKPFAARELLARVARQPRPVAAAPRGRGRVRKSEARLQAAVDLVGPGAYAWDPATGVLEWDDRLKAMWGLPPDAHVDIGCLRGRRSIPRTGRGSRRPSPLHRPRGRSGVYTLEYRVIGIGDGIERWVTTYGRTFFEADRPIEVRRRHARHHRAEAGGGAPARERGAATGPSSSRPGVGDRAGAPDADGRGPGRPTTRCARLLGLRAPRRLSTGRNAVRDRSTPTTWRRCSRTRERGVAGAAYSYANEKRCLASRRRLPVARGRVEPPAVTGRTGSRARPIGVSIIEDIDDRKRAEAACSESEERFRQFAEHSTNVLWIIDAATGRVEYLSPAYERVWGEPVGVLLGRHWDRWAGTVHPDDRERPAAAMARVLQGETSPQEYRIVRPDGAVRWIRDAFFPIRDEQGRVPAGRRHRPRHHGPRGLAGLPRRRQRGVAPASSRSCSGAGYEVKAFASVRAFLEVAPALAAGCVLLDVRAAGGGRASRSRAS